MSDRRKIQDINLPTREREARRPVRSTSSVVSRRRVVRASDSESEERATFTKPKKKTIPRTSSSRRMRTGSPLVVSSREKRAASGGKTLWGLAFVLVIVLGYVISLTSARASLRITLKEQVIAVDTVLALYENSVEDQLDYDTVVFPVEASQSLADAPLVDVSEKASGEIVVYNNFSTSAQKLREETRFEDSSGKIYKLAKGGGITVPGQTLVNGELVPGSIQATVYADNPGPEYNQEPTDFVIPGFRGGPKFEGFYARSVGPLSGGFIGQRPAVEDEDQGGLELALRQEVFDQSRNEVAYRIPEGYMVLPDTEEYTWKEIAFDPQPESGLRAVLKADVSMLLVRKDEIETALLARGGFDEITLPKLMITNLSDLDYVVTTSTQELTNLQVSGSATVRWQVDDLIVKRLVSGVKQRDFASVLRERDEIQSAEAEIKPIWIKQLPKKFEKIDIIYQNIDS